MKHKKLNVITLGGATQDLFLEYDEREMKRITTKDSAHLMLKEGTKIEVHHLHTTIGGGATNSAVSFKKLGFCVRPCFKIANDCPGHAILNILKKQKISTELVIQNSQEKTGLSIIIPSPVGDRTILAFRGANGTLTEDDLPLEAIAHAQCVYITSLSKHASHLLPLITRHAKKGSALVACNPGKSQLLYDTKAVVEALTSIDIFILNMQEARCFFKALQKRTPFSVEKYCAEILKLGPTHVVVTDGEQGVHAATKKELFFQTSLKTGVISTVGAGDAFGSCFVGSLLAGYDVKSALSFAAANASSVLRYTDAQSGLLSFAELKTILAAHTHK